MLVLFVGVIVYFGVFLLGRTMSPYRTETVYRYLAEDAIATNGLVVRTELVLPGATDGGLVDILPAEGQKVGYGNVIARVYNGSDDLARQNEIVAITDQLEELSYFSSVDRSTADVSTLDKEITETLFQIRAETARRDLSDLDQTKKDLETLLLRRGMAYNKGIGLDGLIAALQERLMMLQGQSAGAMYTVYSPGSGTFSARVDGYETLISPKDLMTLTPTTLDALINANPEPDGNAMGKLITDTVWYYATTVSEEDAVRLNETNKVTVRFLRSAAEDVPMEVVFLGVPENGRVLAVFSTHYSLADTTQLRRQSADVILISSEGMRVAKSAVRIRDDGTVGVYVVEGKRASFKSIVIVGEDGDYYLVEPKNPGAYSLHIGSQVLVSGLNVEEGRVIDR